MINGLYIITRIFTGEPWEMYVDNGYTEKEYNEILTAISLTFDNNVTIK